MIEGLQALEGPISVINEGQLQLPPEFDKTKLAGKWEKDGPHVLKAQQNEIIASARVQAKGWTVWLDSAKKPCKRTLGSGTFILMYRPRQLQDAVNALHGNTSRMRLSDEVLGSTIQGQDPQAAEGLLNHTQLSERGLREDLSDGAVLPLNKVDLTQEQQTSEPLQSLG